MYTNFFLLFVFVFIFLNFFDFFLGNRQLISVQFQTNVTSSGTVECFALQSKECATQAEIQFMHVPGSRNPVVWQVGPVPPPRPPPPIEECSGYFNKKLCLNATFMPSDRTCAWCVSNDKIDALCFPTKNEPDQKEWKCEEHVF